MYYRTPLKSVVGLAAALIFSISFCGHAQTVPQYISRLDESSTAKEFQSVFDEMIVTFHAGKLRFEDDDVITVVNDARQKAYADSVLTSVYGWAGSMFGNGRMDDAIVYFMENANLYRKQNKKIGEALSYFEIALIQHKAENFEEAKEYYFKTLAIANDSIGHRTLINCYNGLALILREQQKYDQAIKDFREAYKVAVANKDTAWIAILAGNIGSIHLLNKHYDSSLFYYNRNLRFIKRVAEFENEIETYEHIGRLFIYKKNYAMARAYLDSAVWIITSRKIKFNDFFNPMDAIDESYAKLYAATGDYQKAFEYQTQHYEIAQAKQRQLNGRNLKQLQATYAFKQKQSEYELLQKVNDANVAIIRQQRYTQLAFVIITVLISIQAFVLFRNNRQRKKLNDELVISNEELARLNKIKDQLLSVISHDLRNPLGNLQSVLGLYKSGDLSRAQLDELIVELSSQIKAFNGTLENLLHWARAQLRKVTINPERISLSNITDRVIDQFQKNLEEKKITVNNLLTSAETAWADKNQIEIVLRNLIGNAIKFTPSEGFITITGRKEEDNIIIAVEDNGVGMSDGDIGNLFHADKYFTTQGTNQERGTGIGLLICKEMIVNNGGSIWVESEKGKGTIFTFTLPLPK